MFGRNRQVTIDPSVYEAEDAARRKRELDGLIAANRRRQLAFDTQQLEAEQGRHDAAVATSRAQLEQCQERAQRLADAQAAWAARRNALKDSVAELRTAISVAESRMDSGQLDEATRAAGERAVFERRLATAERDYAAHMQAQPTPPMR